jgi:imidazolonepropionase-like amidohydrolase
MREDESPDYRHTDLEDRLLPSSYRERGMRRLARFPYAGVLWGSFLLGAASMEGCHEPGPAAPVEERTLSIIRSASYALVNGVIIDGTGAAPVQNGILVVKDRTITAVGPRTQVAIPADAEVVDVDGATILPGVINAHVHDAYDESRLETWAWNGVTTVRDEGMRRRLPFETLLAIRDSARVKPECARLVSAGYMMTVPGGYGGLEVTSPADARQRVFEQLDRGVDLIKLAQEDGYAGESDLPKLSGEEISAIIAAAHERGTLVSAHITQSSYWGIVAEAGVDDVAHVAYDPVPDAVLETMVTRKIMLLPTFTIYRNYNAPVSVCIDNLRRHVNRGGSVALGNDYGGGPGSFEEGIPFYELTCMSQAGMSNMSILVACTRNAAQVSHVDSILGTLETGKLADVLVVRGDPLTDLNALSRVRLVIHDGVNIRAERP